MLTNGNNPSCRVPYGDNYYTRSRDLFLVNVTSLLALTFSSTRLVGFGVAFGSEAWSIQSSIFHQYHVRNKLIHSHYYSATIAMVAGLHLDDVSVQSSARPAFA